MAVLSHPKPAPDLLPRRPESSVIESRQRGAKLHVLTYLVGNAIFWTLWAAISVAADAWYWWTSCPVRGGRSCSRCTCGMRTESRLTRRR
jgi:hypothetical protein